MSTIPFAGQLANLLEQGKSLVSALREIELQQRDQDWREVLTYVRAEIEAGNRFSRALARYRRFSDSDIAALAQAEDTGSSEAFRAAVRLLGQEP